MNAIHKSPITNPNHISSYLMAEAHTLLLVTLTGLIFNGFMSVGPILQGRLIDTIVDKDPLRQVLLVAGCFIGIIFLLQLARYFKRYFVRLFANRTSAAMRMVIYKHILRQPITRLTMEHTGDLMTKAVSDVDICVEGMRKVITEIFDTGILILSYLVAMIILSPTITFFSCLFVPFAYVLAQYLKKIIVKYSKDARKQQSIVADFSFESIDHAALLRIHGIEGNNYNSYCRELDSLEQKSIQSMILETSMQPIYNIIAMLGIVAVLYLGGTKVLSGTWSIGMLTSFITMFTALSIKASKSAKLFNSYQKSVVSWERLKPYLSIPYEEERPECVPIGDGTLVVKQLSFFYPGSTNYILKNISFSVKQGEFIGITGSVASGKSTLSLALQGLYPYEGSICYNHMELKDYSACARNLVFSYVGHQPELLSDTIYHNITLGEEGDISSVLREVCLDEEIASMPEGIQTKVGNGGIRLSGGQQARIALARALYHSSAILVLDDPFSAVDRDTERKMMGNIRRNYKGRTILLFSHRISLFSYTDRVIWMEKDGPAIYGTHKDLLQQKEDYRTIYTMQNGGECNEETKSC
ncbi:MAG: ABC transporter ATP-binding protein [Lachnospiraceae bacterium]